MNLRPADGVFSEVMRVVGVTLLCYGSADLSDKFVIAAIVNFVEIKYSV